MNPADILTALHAEGLALTAEGDRIRIEPGDRLTDEAAELIRSNKAALLALLPPSRGPGHPVSTQIVCGLEHAAAASGEARSDDHPTAGTALPACTGVVRLRLVLESEDGARSEAILEIPHERFDGARVLEQFERYRMAGTTRVVSVKQEAADDRHHCRDCARLRNGVCTAAKDIGAQPGYRPVDDLPRRCQGFEQAVSVAGR